MTWKELKQEIESMTPDEQGQEVRVVEDRDDMPGFPVGMARAFQDLYFENEVFIREGEPCLG